MRTVTGYLQDKEAMFMAVPHHAAYSARAEARELDLPADEVVKTVMLSTTAGHVAAVLPASTRIDPRKLVRLPGVEEARLSSEEEIRDDFPDFELGGLPPIPSLLGVPVVVDPHVTLQERVAFALSPTESVEVGVVDLFNGEHLTLALLGSRVGF